MKLHFEYFMQVILSTALLLIISALEADAARGVKVQIRASEQADAPIVEEVQMYGSSYALVIGIDNYTQGWPRLSNAIRDANLVAEELRKKGFEVALKKNLHSDDLERAFREFFVLKGDDPQARLFVWFAGHGYTQSGEGYLIPADSPLPDAGTGFRLKALSMRRFGDYVRQARAKHAFAVFDSCFSGTIFTTQRSKPPAAVTRATTFPVRQFLSSGDENQEVSDDGRFRKLFVRALSGETRADANSDGYLTGSELGMFLTDQVTNLTEEQQTPRYGKLRDEDYNRGDFVFLVSSGGAVVEKTGTINTKAEKLAKEYLAALLQGDYEALAKVSDLPFLGMDGMITGAEEIEHYLRLLIGHTLEFGWDLGITTSEPLPLRIMTASAFVERFKIWFRLEEDPSELLSMFGINENDLVGLFFNKVLTTPVFAVLFRESGPYFKIAGFFPVEAIGTAAPMVEQTND